MGTNIIKLLRTIKENKMRKKITLMVIPYTIRQGSAITIKEVEAIMKYLGY